MSEYTRLHDQRIAAEHANREDNMRQLAELFDSVQRREDELAARDAELRAEHGYSKSYRPDETDTFRDLNEERDFEQSRDEHERFLGRSN